MYAQEEKETFCNAVRNEVKAAGLMDTTDSLWDYFIDKVGWEPLVWASAIYTAVGASAVVGLKRPADTEYVCPTVSAHPMLWHTCQYVRGTDVQVRRNLHVVLCFSPVGDKFRIRARQFPALINCVAIDWFHTWPSEVPPRLRQAVQITTCCRFLVVKNHSAVKRIRKSPLQCITIYPTRVINLHRLSGKLVPRQC